MIRGAPNRNLVRKAFKYRLYPTRVQADAIQAHLGSCRRLYNAMLQQRRTAWREHGRSIGLAEQSRQIVDVARDLPEFGAVYSQVLRDVARRLDRAFQAFFRRIQRGDNPGYPRFKGRNRYASLTYPQAATKGVRIKGNRVTLSKLAENVRFVLHRPSEGRVKTATIRREADRWFLILSCDDVPPAITAGRGSVGLDVGVRHLATLDTGERIENPRFEQQGLRGLRKAHRRVSRRRKGSRRRAKAVLLLQKAYARVRDQRRYHYHKMARALVERYGRIAVEAIEPARMTGSRRVNRSIRDASWRMFLDILRRKAEEAGGVLVEVAPEYTSQACSACGRIVPKAIRDRVHACACGLVMDRDQNAARNILARARLEPSWTAPVGVG